MKAARLRLAGVLLFGVVCLTANAHAASPDIVFNANPDMTSTIILDVRSQEACSDRSLAGARCLPAAGILGPNRRLPNISGLLWLLGTAGLDGDEHVVVAGDKDDDKAFVAGLLYLAGQKQLTVMTARLSDLVPADAKPGLSRSKTREEVYQAEMRSGRVILRRELSQAISANRPPAILDVRSESEYWGGTLRGQRGGHIPGAILFSGENLKLSDAARVVVYGHDTFDGLVALAKLVSQGIEASVLVDGWAGWAGDGALPVDAATYAGVGQSPPAQQMTKPASGPGSTRLLIAAGVLIAGAFAAGYFVRWLGTGNKG